MTAIINIFEHGCRRPASREVRIHASMSSPVAVRLLAAFNPMEYQALHHARRPDWNSEFR